MLDRFPPNLKIAYIDHSDVGENCERDAPWHALAIGGGATSPMEFSLKNLSRC